MHWKSNRNIVEEQEEQESFEVNEAKEAKDLWIEFIKSITISALKDFPRSARLRLMSAYFFQEKLQNKFKALYELLVIEDIECSLQVEFSVYRFK